MFELQCAYGAANRCHDGMRYALVPLISSHATRIKTVHCLSSSHAHPLPNMKVLAYIAVIATALGIAAANPLEARCVGGGGACTKHSDCCIGICFEGVRTVTGFPTSSY
jgi:hypothetical protein